MAIPALGAREEVSAFTLKLQDIQKISQTRFKWLMFNDDDTYKAVGLLTKIYETIKGWLRKTDHTSPEYIHRKIS